MNNNEFVDVRIGFGQGITFEISLLAEKGISEEVIKAKAYEWFKQHMPTREQIENVETLIADKKAFIEVKHEDL